MSFRHGTSERTQESTDTTFFHYPSTTMANSDGRTRLAGPGHPGQHAQRASWSTSNPPSTNSPAIRKGSKAGGSSISQQTEEDSDRTLQMIEGSPSPTCEEVQSQEPNIVLPSSKSASTETVRGIIVKSKKGTSVTHQVLTNSWDKMANDPS